MRRDRQDMRLPVLIRRCQALSPTWLCLNSHRTEFPPVRVGDLKAFYLMKLKMTIS